MLCSVVEEDRSCVVSVTSNSLHIAKPITGSSSASKDNAGLHCGTKTQPWLLEAPAGQRINISLLDFTMAPPGAVAALMSDTKSQDPAASSRKSTGSNFDRCAHLQQKHQYGYVIDKSPATKKNVSICGGPASGSQRLAHVYLSSGNVVELVLTPAEQQSGNGPEAIALIRFEGELCASCLLSLIIQDATLTADSRFLFMTHVHSCKRNSLASGITL
jgi:hypothetical protein